MAQGSTADVHVTTNGTVLTPAVEELMVALRMNLTISIDGATAKTVEAVRVGADHRALMANVDRFQDVVAGYGGSIVLNFCLVVSNWRELGPFLAEADQRGLTARVVLVTKPDEHSVEHLAPEALADVVAELRSEDERWRGELHRNRSVWISELDRLGALASDRSREVTAPVTIRAAAGDEICSAPGSEDLIDGLVAWAGREPISVDIEQGLIVDVEAPGWAMAQLGPLDWVGLGGTEILDSLADRVPGRSPYSSRRQRKGS